MLILDTTEDGKSQIQLRAENQTVWLSQREMAQLFDVSTIGLHFRSIYEDGELAREATAEEAAVGQLECDREVRRPVTLYSTPFSPLAIACGARPGSGLSRRDSLAGPRNKRISFV